MEKEHVTGKLDEVKGRAKQEVGRATHNTRMEGEGVVDEAKGKAKQAYGDVKETIRHADKQAGTDIHKK